MCVNGIPKTTSENVYPNPGSAKAKIKMKKVCITRLSAGLNGNQRVTQRLLGAYKKKTRNQKKTQAQNKTKQKKNPKQTENHQTQKRRKKKEVACKELQKNHENLLQQGEMGTGQHQNGVCQCWRLHHHHYSLCPGWCILPARGWVYPALLGPTLGIRTWFWEI